MPNLGLQGQNMPAFHVTGTGGREKKKVYFQCQIHAREWISGATCMYVVDHLLNNYKVDAEVQ